MRESLRDLRLRVNSSETVSPCCACAIKRQAFAKPSEVRNPVFSLSDSCQISPRVSIGSLDLEKKPTALSPVSTPTSSLSAWSKRYLYAFCSVSLKLAMLSPRLQELGRVRFLASREWLQQRVETLRLLAYCGGRRFKTATAWNMMSTRTRSSNPGFYSARESRVALRPSGLWSLLNERHVRFLLAYLLLNDCFQCGASPFCRPCSESMTIYFPVSSALALTLAPGSLYLC